MKLIWPGVFLGTGAVGTVGGLYGNSLYLKSVSRQEANVKFEEIRSEIEAFVKDFGNNEEENISTVLNNLWIDLLSAERKNKNFEELKESLKDYLKENQQDKEETLKKLYKKMEDFVKFSKDNGINIDEYQNKIASISLSQEEEETLLTDN